MNEQLTTEPMELSLLTPEEIAGRLRVPKRTLYEWRRNGKGPAGLRIGKHLRYTEQAYRDFITKLEDGAI